MPVTELDLSDRRERRRFVALEQELLSGEPLFVPEIAADVDKRLRGRSPFYEEMEHTAFLASDGRTTARCAALINHRWQRDKGEDAGFIGYFAAAPGAEVLVREMLGAAESWLAERGASRAIAPFNGASFHGLAALTDAFDEEPIFPMTWQPAHYAHQLEAAGYRPTYPFWVYEIDFSSERYLTTSRRALEDARCTVRPLVKKRWNDEIETLRTVFNECFREEWEFHAMTSDEFHELFDQLKPVLDQRQMLFAGSTARRPDTPSGCPTGRGCFALSKASRARCRSSACCWGPSAMTARGCSRSACASHTVAVTSGRRWPRPSTPTTRSWGTQARSTTR